MTYQTKPTADGVYRIKVLTLDLVIESVPGSNPGLKLASPSSSNNKQKWNLTQVPNERNVWTMTSVEDQAGVTHLKTDQTYRGLGYPYPQNGPSQKWSILEQKSEGQTFSKIRLSGGSGCFDSRGPHSDAVHFYNDHTNASDGPKQCYVFEQFPAQNANPVDVMFIQDFTGSQQPYIDAARNEISTICNNLIAAANFAPGDLRFGLIAFRDHPPQDDSFITKDFDFTSDATSMASNLASLVATGGGDGPEAQSDALSDALSSSWNDKATKVVVLITDAPPHGIGEDGDGFPDGCPLQIDPVRIAKRMLKVGIVLYVIACEPTLSQYYKKAHDFYVGLAEITGGKVFSLGDDPNVLTNLIVASALESVDSDALVAQHQAAIRKQAQIHNFSAAQISQKLYHDLSAENVYHYTLAAETIYEPNEQGDKNAQIWFEAETLKDAKARIQEVSGNRIKSQYLSGDSPATAVEKKPINLAQVESIVQKSLVRGS